MAKQLILLTLLAVTAMSGYIHLTRPFCFSIPTELTEKVHIPNIQSDVKFSYEVTDQDDQMQEQHVVETVINYSFPSSRDSGSQKVLTAEYGT